MHKDEAEMRSAAKLVRYEWDQFSWATRVINEYWDPEPGTGNGDHSQDALVEVILVHARALRDFFLNRRIDLRKSFETDILAEDFFDDPNAWTRPTFSYLVEARTKERLDRALAHLTYTRLDYAADKKWKVESMRSEIETAWTAFLKALPPDRASWFAPGSP